MSDTSKLSLLGAKKTEYKLSAVTPEILETFVNQHPNNLYLVPFVQDHIEFTSLCPKTGQPDYAAMEIIYVPKTHLVESKSMKLYLFSFRNSGEFHEDVCNRICNDLYDLLHPYYIRVVGKFTPRGGLAIRPIVQRWSPELEKHKTKELSIVEEIRFLVNTFDIKAL